MTQSVNGLIKTPQNMKNVLVDELSIPESTTSFVNDINTLILPKFVF